ncbi:related to ER-Golgi SNARE complex subunit BET1 protein [Cephalotrichum gorgonifer]|uniref:Related to ER-Golgi SNARE complex subunit BET1 protein n=1 Tax=Cephalotrichum gorgonifer TaxID=2041049 RepID=A0AAE8SWA1_9PEZI|nr:related to ER-Golgi SNARE complex subunit BET1 protein [Cephalotrichum gorgonifer]
MSSSFARPAARQRVESPSTWDFIAENDSPLTWATPNRGAQPTTARQIQRQQQKAKANARPLFLANRFAANPHQRDPRSALFAGYDGGEASRRPVSASPNRYGGYGYPGSGVSTPGANGSLGVPGGAATYRPATPNKKGQYSNAVLDELESQNDHQVEGILGKVRTLKDMTMAIGDEIRESSALAEKMNEGFDNTRVRLRGTMNRMLVMAQRTGVGWKAWLAFFAAVIFIFMYVWLF